MSNSDSIEPNSIVEEPPTTVLGNAQDDGKWSPDCPPVDPTLEDYRSECISGVSLLTWKEGLAHSLEIFLGVRVSGDEIVYPLVSSFIVS